MFPIRVEQHQRAERDQAQAAHLRQCGKPGRDAERDDIHEPCAPIRQRQAAINQDANDHP